MQRMAITVYSVRDDEVAYFQQWQQAHPEEQVQLIKVDLTVETATLAAGSHSVILLQTKPVDVTIIQVLAQLQVANLIVRAVGVDNIDAKAITQFGMQLANVPSYSPRSVAEFTVLQLLQLLRQSFRFNIAFKKGDFRWTPFLGEELVGKTVGVIGTGRIGAAVIAILKGFDVHILAYSHHHNLAAQGVQYVDQLPELYRRCDVLTLHIPGNAENTRLIDGAAFQAMKPGMILLNMARGSVVDTQALLAAMDQHIILATYDNEAPYFGQDYSQRKIDDLYLRALMQRDDVLLAPHMAFYTKPAVENMVNQALDKSLAFLQNTPTLEVH
ncbi:d-lactate dehydrogenase [Agrilactobacillus composti DSM 18527 = JCM 14202]|uniref:D-lactate dehydrogenase n=3 Tax=Agrilactobacillus TaxID=2767875 RepID=A0A0R1Y216_9LACO|nr:d-lactate dehydrogenase [Agrilactobacillus composti DSM 18527 = JCM 14202]